MSHSVEAGCAAVPIHRAALVFRVEEGFSYLQWRKGRAGNTLCGHLSATYLRETLNPLFRKNTLGAAVIPVQGRDAFLERYHLW